MLKTKSCGYLSSIVWNLLVWFHLDWYKLYFLSTIFKKNLIIYFCIFAMFGLGGYLDAGGNFKPNPFRTPTGSHNLLLFLVCHTCSMVPHLLVFWSFFFSKSAPPDQAARCREDSQTAERHRQDQGAAAGEARQPVQVRHMRVYYS